MSIDACVCLSVIWYWCSPGMRADVFPEESQFNWVYDAFVVGVHVVSATPLEDRIYVTCSYVFVFCHVSKVFFFVQFFQFIQFHSCRDFWWLGCKQATSPDAQPSSQSLSSGQKGRSSTRWFEDLHAATWEFQAEVGDDIWAIRACLSSSSPESAWSNQSLIFQHRWDPWLITL